MGQGTLELLCEAAESMSVVIAFFLGLVLLDWASRNRRR